MLATWIIRCPLIRFAGGLRPAPTYSCEGGASLLQGGAYGQESWVIANQVQRENCTASQEYPYKPCVFHYIITNQ